MKALSMDLRERVVAFVKAGAGKQEAAKHFKISRRSVYRYLDADAKGRLEPKKSWGKWRKLDPDKLAGHVKNDPDATLAEMGKVFVVSHNAVWVRLGQLGITLKKKHKIPEKKRGAAMALQTRTRSARSRQNLLHGRERD
jgi:transposase